MNEPHSTCAGLGVPRLNPTVVDLQPSATIAIKERSNELLQYGKPVFKLGLGQSPFSVPDPVVNELKSHAPEKDYLPPWYELVTCNE